MPLKDSTETKRWAVKNVDMDRTWTIVGVGGSPRVPGLGNPGKEDQELRDRPKYAFGIQGSRTDHRPCSIRSEKGNNSFLKTSIMKTKELGGKGGELFVPGSPVAGFSGTTRILRMVFQLSHPFRF
ncbi:hypothetical protein KSP40_PGU010198 [Platanthera guangdongensis]|uniref:Uncharacterized protein n=1 Tax=Platanthera guangdongensis TaxID=2320717 RepID=A0ABR2MUV9_9ASPA